MARRPLHVLLTPLAVLALAAAPVPATTTDELGPDDPAYHEREARNAAAMLGRQRDQLTNPEFAAAATTGTLRTFPENLARQLEQPTSPIISLGQLVPGGRAADPFRVTWAEDGRGVQTRISYDNQHGATIRGSLWAPPLPFTDPVTGTRTDGPLPTIVLTTGSIQGFQEMYLWAAQGLAEAGYLVMTYDVQGQGISDTFPGGDVAGCDLLGFLQEAASSGSYEDSEACPGVPFQQRANFVEGTEDALDWLVSDDNPLRALVDTDRIGLTGHSLGASAVTEVGNRDVPVPHRPEIAVRAVVAWDGEFLNEELVPRVPTMGQSAEAFFLPGVDAQPPDAHAHLGTHERFVAAGVPSYQSTFASSTHLEWTYIPVLLPASSAGERVAMHQTLAWLDHYVKAAPSDEVSRADRRAQVHDAHRRLVAEAFDGSADRSAIGAGPWTPTEGNTPIRIEGDAVADHLSYKYRSAYAFDGLRCDDVRNGCDIDQRRPARWIDGG